MKKWFRAAAAVTAAVMLLSFACFAGDFTVLADELHSMKMFMGTDAGYDLDKTPTRAQAAVMLVRLLGQEEQAKADYAAGKITHSYVDATMDWAAPAVAYMYANGLTNGMGKNAKGQDVFGTYGDCSAQMYCTFLLRALGYQDQGTQPDFAYANAIEFAKQKGIVEDVLLSQPFTRDSVVAASYQTLSLPVRDGSGLLLEKLIASGAVDADAAAATLAKMKAFRNASGAAQKLDGLTAVDLTMDVETTIGTPLNLDSSIRTQIQYVAGDALQYALTVEMGSAGQAMQGGQWYKDGWLYTMDVLGNATKTQATFAPEELESTISQTDSDTENLYMLGDWTCRTENGKTICSGRLSARFYDEIRRQTEAQFTGTGLTVAIDDVTYEYTLAEDGTLLSLVTAVDMTVSSEGTEIPARSVVTLTVNATGDQVVVNYPDLSQFTEAQ